MHAVKNAIFIDSQKAVIISLSAASAVYQRSVKPRQALGTGESLNEKTTSARIGRYRKAYPAPSAVSSPSKFAIGWVAMSNGRELLSPVIRPLNTLAA